MKNSLINDPKDIQRILQKVVKGKHELSADEYVEISSKIHLIQNLPLEELRLNFISYIIHFSPKGFELLTRIGAIKYIFPGVEKLVGLEQNKYHFGDVWQHTLACVLRCFDIPTAYRPILLNSCILHDIGKIKTRTIDENGVVHFKGHEIESAKMAGKILEDLGYSKKYIQVSQFIIKNHMVAKQWGDDCSGMKKSALRKLQYEAKTLIIFEALLYLIHIDNMSHNVEYCYPNQVDIIRKATEKMIEDGTTMFGYVLPVTEEDIIELKGSDCEVKKYIDHCFKLAFHNPLVTKDYLLGHIKNLKL